MKRAQRDKKGSFDPRDFLRNVRFSPEEIDRHKPGARRVWTGGLFVSHSGVDTNRIRRDIIAPVVEKRFPVDGYFLHNRSSGGAEIYRELILAALNFCDKFMVVVSKDSVRNAWVQAEVEWAFAHHRPIIGVLFDVSSWAELHSRFSVSTQEGSCAELVLTDFRSDTHHAQKELASILDQLLRKLPYTGEYSPHGREDEA